MQILFKNKFLDLYPDSLSDRASSLINGPDKTGPFIESWRPMPDGEDGTY